MALELRCDEKVIDVKPNAIRVSETDLDTYNVLSLIFEKIIYFKKLIGIDPTEGCAPPTEPSNMIDNATANNCLANLILSDLGTIEKVL